MNTLRVRHTAVHFNSFFICVKVLCVVSYASGHSMHVRATLNFRVHLLCSGVVLNNETPPLSRKTVQKYCFLVDWIGNFTDTIRFFCTKKERPVSRSSESHRVLLVRAAWIYRRIRMYSWYRTALDSQQNRPVPEAISSIWLKTYALNSYICRFYQLSELLGSTVTWFWAFLSCTISIQSPSPW